MTTRRKLIIALGIVVASVVCGFALVHTSVVQGPLVGALSGILEEKTGLRVEIDQPRIRLWPARFIGEGIRISAGGRVVGTIEHLEARWSWMAISGTPRRIEDIVIRGLEIDLREPVELPSSASSEGQAPVDPWRTVEIGRLEMTGGGGAAEVLDILGRMEGLKVEFALESGRAVLDLHADRLQLRRSERPLELGPVAVRGFASPDGLIVDELQLGGGDLALEGRGEVAPAVGGSVRGSFRVRADLEQGLAWWDPNLVTGLGPAGVLDLDGRLSYSEEDGIAVSAVHLGDRFELAGYGLDELEIGLSHGIPEIHAAGATWGSATVSVDESGVADVLAKFASAPVERILAFAFPEISALLDGPVRLSGEMEGTVSYPFALETLSGRVDLEIDSTKGRIAVKGGGAGEAWSVSEARATLPDASVAASGTIASGGVVDAELDLRIDGGSAVAGLIDEWVPDLDLPALAGGPIAGRIGISGTLDRPRYDADLEWASPVIMETAVDSIRASLDGDLQALEFTTTIAAEGVEITADGTAATDGSQARGNWSFDFDHLHRLSALVGPEVVTAEEITGTLKGRGEFLIEEGRWAVYGGVRGFDLGLGSWRSRELDVVFHADPDVLDVSKISIAAFGGSIFGSGTVGLSGLDAGISVNAQWREIDLGRLSMEESAIDPGMTSGEVEIVGTIADPAGRIELEWRPTGEDSSIPGLKAAGVLEEGVLSFMTEEISTEGGQFWAEGEAPMGLLPRPAWLWPDAPEHAIRVSARGHGLDTRAIVDMLGLEQPPVNATSDLDLDASWHPDRAGDTRVLAELRDLRLHHLGGEIAADGPVTVRATDERVELDPVVLSGPQTHISARGGVDLQTRELDGSIEAVLAPGFARNIPYPIQIHEPIGVSATMGGTIESPKAALSVDHTGGALVMRDPPLRIRDLVVSAEVDDGVLWINDGRAQVNQGVMEVGGGWDPVSRQGIVAEIENVVVFVGGILSQWSGAVAIEPEPGRLARMTGELNLIAGLWDQNVSLGGALFGSQSLEAADDDPMNDIILDLDVRGRGVVRVENNLGRFDARWDVLRVRGSAARPRLNGEISIAPGGRFSLAGQRVTVRRGGLLFTGDPDVDPIVEIVPESDFAVFGSAEGQERITSMATYGLAEGLAGALGFENETLQPAEISVETEKDTSSHFMLGQRVSHNIALFFATNTTDVQDRTSMLQFWNLPGLKGLAIQAYDKTLTEEIGGNVIQRFQWGGSSIYDDRPTIRKLRLNGDWPVSKRRLKKSTGFRRGQPFDPFLEFVAKVRMERTLAAAGFQEARVRAKSVESNNAWTLNFECEPGERQEIHFEGDVPPQRLRGEVTALYRHAPLEAFGFRNMESLLRRHYDVEGYPDATVVIERRGDLVVAEISREGLTELVGPVLEGVPEPVSEAVVRRLGRPTELAILADNEDRAIVMIERVLADQGYRGARVESVESVPISATRAEVRAVVELGSRAVVGELVVQGSDPLGLTESEDFTLRVGEPLDRMAIDLAASGLRAGYDAAGYSDAVVRGSAEESPEGIWVVTVRLDPGIQRILQDVVVNGLNHTSQRSIVSGVSIEEGEILRSSDLDATAARVANFAPIERVDVRTTPRGSNGATVEIDVIEKPRWTTEVGGGWSTERGIQARFGLRDDNLLGRGFGLNLRGRWDQVEWLGFIVASLPPLPGKKLSFTSTVGFSRGEPPEGSQELLQDEAFWSFETTRWLGGGEMATGHAGEQVTAYYRFSRTRTYDRYPPDPDDFFPIPIDITVDIGLLGARYVRDRFDYPFDPTRGYGLMFDIGYSDDLLASDLDYWTALANGSVATNVFGSTTWMQAVRIGAAVPLDGTNLIRDNKFFAGGQGSVRGFDRNSLGPVRFAGEEGFEPAGGGALFILNEELRIPVWGNFRAAVFADIGQVWEDWGQADFNLSVGVGVGVRWATPIGPLWADVAWPVVNTGISSTKPKFYIGIGRPF